MDMERIVGAVFSGFMCKLYAAGMAVYVAAEVLGIVTETVAAATLALS